MEQLETIILNETKQLVDTVHEFSRRQKEDWQKIPLLALEADGRTGFSETYQRAYVEGLWALSASVQNGYYTCYVDLASGELVDAYAASTTIPVNGVNAQKEPSLVPAKEQDVLLLAHKVEQLSAKRIIAFLEQAAREPYPSYYDSYEQEAWRENMKRELGLSQQYIR